MAQIESLNKADGDDSELIQLANSIIKTIDNLETEIKDLIA